MAELANLELTPDELDTYRAQLDEILAYVDKLKELDVTSVEPMAQVLHQHGGAGTGGEEIHAELRNDVLLPCDMRDAVVSNSSDSAPPFFRVPRVIDR